MEVFYKFLEIYACLYIVITCHELGHYIALKRFKCKVASITIGYGGIIRLWHRNTFYSIGIIPGGCTEATGLDKLNIWRFIICCLSGLIASIIMFYLVSITCMFYATPFLRLLQLAFLFDMFIGFIPYKNNDMGRVWKKIKSNDYGTE